MTLGRSLLALSWVGLAAAYVAPVAQYHGARQLRVRPVPAAPPRAARAR